MAGVHVKPSNYQDFEPYCKWRIEEGRDILEIQLHGFRKEQVRIQRSSLGSMTITGERRVDQSRWTRFRKEIKVPKGCKINEISAKLTGGVLYIYMPKKSTLPSSQDEVTAPGQNPENEQTNPKINNVTKNLAGAVENYDMTTKNAIMLLTDAVFRLKMRKKMGLNVALAVVFMVAFAIYKNRQPPRVEN
ncbi:hypothetical protein SADUNF_Sadunf19G0045100 [Salix dunnii]|uniref:SHSP domain-containing protein n=1 Tax=Salix dunnii TaxID=1413687 RepID=A0A835IYE2_9ROSI|nr:hypothetical protein SADUNF_Sadunf19G0045100 [Salix dunnii]